MKAWSSIYAGVRSLLILILLCIPSQQTSADQIKDLIQVLDPTTIIPLPAWPIIDPGPEISSELLNYWS